MPEPFYDHLAVCSQCERNPFGLCAVGARALEQQVQLSMPDLLPLHAHLLHRKDPNAT